MMKRGTRAWQMGGITITTEYLIWAHKKVTYNVWEFRHNMAYNRGKYRDRKAFTILCDVALLPPHT
jgi:hypothetical protein